LLSSGGKYPKYEVAFGHGRPAVLVAAIHGSGWRPRHVTGTWVPCCALYGSLQTVTAVAITIMVLLGFAAIVGGALIALFASRRAPDGFEDQDGFHVGPLPTARDK
jgi:hypothetical protein